MGENDEWEGKNGKGKRETISGRERMGGDKWYRMNGRERMGGEKWYRMNWRERRRQNE